MRLANGTRRYFVATSPIGGAQAESRPWYLLYIWHYFTLVPALVNVTSYLFYLSSNIIDDEVDKSYEKGEKLWQRTLPISAINEDVKYFLTELFFSDCDHDSAWQYSHYDHEYLACNNPDTCQYLPGNHAAVY